jgi:hypothetical protein
MKPDTLDEPDPEDDDELAAASEEAPLPEPPEPELPDPAEPLPAVTALPTCAEIDAIVPPAVE